MKSGKSNRKQREGRNEYRKQTRENDEELKICRRILKQIIRAKNRHGQTITRN